MFSPTVILWNVSHPFYTYGSLIIIALIVWRVRKRCCDRKSGNLKTCCQHHQKVKQKSKDKPPRARRLSWKETEKPRGLLSVIKSQGWLPQEGSVRRLLCSDPNCVICNDVALEIQQLLAGENTCMSPTSSGPSHGSSAMEMMSLSSISLEHSRESMQTREHSPPREASKGSQLTDKKSITQSSAHLTSAVSIHDYWTGHQLGQGAQASDITWNSRTISSPSLEKSRAPLNPQDKKKSHNELVLEKKQESGTGNKMELFPQWMAREVKGQGRKEPVPPSKTEIVAKTAKNDEKRLTPSKNLVRDTKSEKTVEENGVFFDAPVCIPGELQQNAVHSCHSWVLCSAQKNAKLTCAIQPENSAQVSSLTSAKGTKKYKNNQSR